MVLCEVQVNRLQMDDRQYIKGDSVDLPDYKAKSLGNSVMILDSIETAEPVKETAKTEEVETVPNEESEEQETKKSTRKSRRSKK